MGAPGLTFENARHDSFISRWHTDYAAVPVCEINKQNLDYTVADSTESTRSAPKCANAFAFDEILQQTTD